MGGSGGLQCRLRCNREAHSVAASQEARFKLGVGNLDALGAEKRSRHRHLRSLDFPGGCSDVGAVDIRDGLSAAIAHRQFQFSLQNFDHAIDAGLAKRS